MIMSSIIIEVLLNGFPMKWIYRKTGISWKLVNKYIFVNIIFSRNVSNKDYSLLFPQHMFHACTFIFDIAFKVIRAVDQSFPWNSLSISWLFSFSTLILNLWFSWSWIKYFTCRQLSSSESKAKLVPFSQNACSWIQPTQNFGLNCGKRTVYGGKWANYHPKTHCIVHYQTGNNAWLIMYSYHVKY